MKRHRPTNREFDELGRRLVIAASPGEGEIDRLAANPRLYNGVLAKLAASAEPVPAVQGWFTWKPVAAMAMTFALLSIPLLAYLKYSGSSNAVVKVIPARPATVRQDPGTRDIVSEPLPSAAGDERPRPIRTVMTKNIEPPPPPKAARSRPVRRPEPEPAFHPIGSREKAEDAAIDGRVVRVEMPRAALFAMGVDVPLENGTRTIRADLLLGADGSPRAIRLVD